MSADKKSKKKKNFPEGTWLVIGFGIGIIFGVTTDTIGYSIGVGAGIGIVLEYYHGSLFKK